MILGIVGSPRKGRLTDQLVTQVLEGAKSKDAETKKVYLVDFRVPFYTEQAKCSEELIRLCKEADALVIGAPVYYGGINGLTKDFMDTAGRSLVLSANGKYALGISVAGGTGKGLCLAIQSIYTFFNFRRYRGIDPTPVSRFNFQIALDRLYMSGQKLAKLSKEKKPFKDDLDVLEYYEKLEYMSYTWLDEMLLLSEQLIDASRDKPNLLKAKENCEIAKSLITQGKRIEAARYAIKAYDLLYF